ncbi:glycosyltransferase family 39 protein, partial [Candidatus Sumerlaeota bacterium]|nr:glycosyltransferase family 39 protein [Candidatus Sumerlaeota bacterium]
MNFAAFFTRHRAIILLLAVGLASRFFHLDHRGLWTDEFKTLATTRMSPSELVKERMSKGHFPTYFLMVRGWSAIAGDGEKSLRFPSLAAGILAILFIHRAASKIWGSQIAFWAALFFLVNERALWASQEARSYSWVMLAAIASFDALIQALKFPSPIRWTAYAFWTLFGMLLHATYPWVFLSQIAVIAVWLARIRRARWDWIGITAAIFLIGGAAYKLLASLQTNESFYSERHWTEPAKIIEGFLEIFWGEYSQGFGQSFDLYAPLITLGLIALAWRNTRQLSGNSLASPGASPPPYCSPPIFALTAAWAVSALVGMVLYSALIKDVVHGARYYSAGVGGAAILESLAIAPLRRKPVKVFLAVICLAIHTLSSAAWYRNSG